MNSRIFKGTLAVLTLAMLVMAATTANAADLYWSGTGTWDNSTSNWGSTTGGPYTTTTWNNAPPDSAIFEGTAGTVTLGEPITIGDMTINVGGYTITGSTLDFSTGGTITNTGIDVTIESGITGAPAVSANQGSNKNLTFAPTGANVALGAVSGGGSIVQFGGDATSNNSVVSVNAKGRWNGAGTWTLTGRAYAYEHWINSGTLIIGENGSIKSNNRELRLESAATLHYNNPGAVEDGAGFGMRGSIDNTSGAAITESTYNPRQTWGDWTFIGSGGAASDLYLGTGAVTLNSNPTVTVQNAATTLTVGGAVADSATTTYGITKAGAGTLALTGATNYKGNTTVAAGTLSVGDGTNSADLAAEGVVSVVSGALLDLNFASANIDDVFLLQIDGSAVSAGQYGHSSSGADNGGAGVGVYNAFFSGTGILNSAGGIWNDGRHYWDGPTTGGTGDGVSDGGAGTWSTSVASWDRGYTAREGWTNATTEKAIFAGTAGEVTLGTDITLGEMVIARDGYEISGHNLNFGGAKTITMNSTTGGNNVNLGTIASGITGASAVFLNAGVNNRFNFAPTEGSMELGAVSGGGMIGLGGTTSGNSVASVSNSKIRLDGSGTWTVLGDAIAYEHFLVNGTLIVEGLIKCNNRALHLYDGGTLVVNGSMQSGNYALNAVAGATVKGTGTILTATTVQAGGTIAPGDPTGTLTIENKDCTIAGTLAITVDGDSYSTLAVGGTLDISAETATLDIIETSAGLGDMVIATYTTLIGDWFTTVNGLPDGWTIDYGYNAGTAIALTGGTIAYGWVGTSAAWGSANWDAGEGAVAPETGGDMTIAVTGAVVNVADNFGPAASVTIDDNSELVVDAEKALGVTGAVDVGADATLTVNGTLTAGVTTVDGTLQVDGILNAETGSVAGTLAGTGLLNLDPITVTGTVAPGAVAPGMDYAIGRLTVAATAELWLDSGTYNAEVSLGDGVATIEADQILINVEGVVGGDEGGIDYEFGTLTPKGVGRTNADFSDRVTLKVVDNPDGGVVTGVGDLREFGSVDPAPAGDASAHFGQGAFLRAVTYPKDGNKTIAVELDVFVAMAGDADGDGLIGLLDWGQLRNNFGQTGKDWTDGNFDSWDNGTVDLVDWGKLRDKFGQSYATAGAAAGAAAVPEPGTIVMLLAALAALAVLGWRRRAA